jgi:hypothetical protein
MASILSRTQDSRLLMLTCLAIAACSAVGHHCFYQSLRGQRVDEQKFDQNVNVYIGTALTVLTKLSLTAAVTLAYSQILWQRLLGRRLRISHIDSLSSLVATPSALNDWRILRNFPLLTTLAMMAWCMPIITVFPPGTLSVVADLANSTVSASVPSMDFTHALVSDNSSRAMSHGNSSTFPAGLKTSAGVLAAMTAFTGSIPRIQQRPIPRIARPSSARPCDVPPSKSRRTTCTALVSPRCRTTTPSCRTSPLCLSPRIRVLVSVGTST